MQHKTEGIVLSIRKHNDKFSITHVFTPDFGRVAYLLPNSKSKKSRINRSVFFPLSVVALEVEHFPLRQIHRLYEAQRQFPLYSINVEFVKLSIAFFLSEFLAKVLQEKDENRLLFNFIKDSILTLEKKEKGFSNFHLAFMFKFAHFLGISPNLDDYKEGCYFDLINGEYSLNKLTHTHFLNFNQSNYLNIFKRINFNNMHLFRLSHNDRNEMINYMLDYYRIHIYNFPEIKSLQILRDLY
ncbi:MAG: DNA repair protein RecO [Candidatus Saccharimonadaceae bacterium]